MGEIPPIDKLIKSNANLGRGKTLVYGLICVWEVMFPIPSMDSNLIDRKDSAKKL